MSRAFKVLAVSGPDKQNDGQQARIFVPLAMKAGKAPEGCLSLSQFRELLSDRFGIMGEEADEIMIADGVNHMCTNADMCDGTKSIMVKTSSKEVVGAISINELYQQYVMQQMPALEAWKNLSDEEKSGQKEPKSALMVLAKQRLGRHGDNDGCPYIINNPLLYNAIWPGGYVHAVGKTRPTPQKPFESVVMYLGSYRNYGLFHWPVDVIWGHYPVSGDIPAHSLGMTRQVIFDLVALKVMSEVDICYNYGGALELPKNTAKKLVEMLPIRWYLNSIFGRGSSNQERFEKIEAAIGQLIQMLSSEMGPEPETGQVSSNRFGIGRELYKLGKLGMMAQEWWWLHRHPRAIPERDLWTEFVQDVSERGHKELYEFLKDTPEEETCIKEELERNSAVR